MKKVVIDEPVLRQLYLDEKLSLRQIADKLDHAVSTIVRYMNMYGIPRRNRSEAQSHNLEVRGHPWTGKTHDAETKRKISHKLGEFWENLSDKEREHYRKLVGSGWKRKWASMSEEDRKQMLAMLKEYDKTNAGKGSRFERFVADQLRNRGYVVEERSKHYLANAKFEVDIALPNEGIMIEVDGPTHFEPVYGDELLERRQEKDAEKDDYLTSAGFSVLRIRDKNGPLSQYRIEKITEKIEEIKKNGKRKVWIMH